MAGALGRLIPPDTEHLDKYPLSALAPEARPIHVPVTIGISWYTGFDSPQKASDGKYYLPTTNLGSIRGGHCTCLEPAYQTEIYGGEQNIRDWWVFYNQGQEGACEGFGHSRAMSLLYRKQFDAFRLYDDARRIEGTYPNGEGTTNRSACAALVKWGDHPQNGEEAHRDSVPLANPTHIKTYRWATTWQEVLETLGYKEGPVPLLNSWGTQYPEEVLVPDELGVLLIEKEQGEADIFTEK